MDIIPIVKGSIAFGESLALPKLPPFIMKSRKILSGGGFVAAESRKRGGLPQIIIIGSS